MKPTRSVPGTGPGLGVALALAAWACAPGPAPRTTEPAGRPSATPSPPGPARARSGEPCLKDADCVAGLSCTMNVCRTLEPSCRWSIDCLTKLKALHPQEGVGYEVGRFLRKLVEQPHPMDCEDMPERIAHLLNNRPWEWKKACGAPPVSGVIRPTDRRLPFRIVDYKVKESQVPADEKPEIHQRHSTHPDLCKAWVKFVLIRPYQGFVVAQIKEQYDCRAATAEALKADPDARPTCSKTRPYPVTDRRYIPLHPAGSEFSWNFYFSTPPEVCRKPGLTDKSFPRGCFCLGIDTSTVALIAEEDPFLFKDEMASPRRVPD